jgi:hypothetical protein
MFLSVPNTKHFIADLFARNKSSVTSADQLKIKGKYNRAFRRHSSCQRQIVTHSKWYHFPLATIQIWSQVARLWKSCLAIPLHPPSERIIQVAKRYLTAANRIKYDYFVTSEIRKFNLKQFRLKTEIPIPVPSDLRRGFAEDRFLGLPVRIRPRTWISLMSVVWCQVGVSRRRADPWSREILPMI